MVPLDYAKEFAGSRIGDGFGRWASSLPAKWVCFQLAEAPRNKQKTNSKREACPTESQSTLFIAFVIHYIDLVVHTYLDWRSGHRRFISSLV